MLSRTYLDRHMFAPEILAAPQAAVAVYLARRPDASHSEDAAAVIALPDGTLLGAVADGAGGHPCGEKAAALAVNEIVQQIQSGNHPLTTRILDGFESANAKILDLKVGAASTLTVALIQNSQLRTFHTGDSGALVVGPRGRMKRRTVGHSARELGVAAGLLEENDMVAAREWGHLVTNVLGTREFHIEVGSSQPIAMGDTVLIASDGLFDNLSLTEISTSLGGPLEVAAQKLHSLCEERMQGEAGTPDDCSFILLKPLINC